MQHSVSRGAPDPHTSVWIVVGMLAMIILPAAIALNTVRAPGELKIVESDPTPYGYTWSLLLFIVPILVIALVYLPRAEIKIPRQAFWWTIGILVPVGFATDFFFASRFFVFGNPGATLGISAPALNRPVPVEEYVFYLTGFIAVLLIYLWLDEYWLGRYAEPDYRVESKKIPCLLQFHPLSALLGTGLIVFGIIYKKLFSPNPEGFPEYFIFLVLVGFVPSAGFFRTARSFINWRALSFTLFFVLLLSLLWEATLAVPYRWWGYQDNQMLGIRIGAWSRLPIEAVCLWIAVTYTTVSSFEIVKLWLASGRSAKHAFFGEKPRTAVVGQGSGHA
jgi:lycopene cyclase domain-containing protein